MKNWSIKTYSEGAILPKPHRKKMKIGKRNWAKFFKLFRSSMKLHLGTKEYKTYFQLGSHFPNMEAVHLILASFGANVPHIWSNPGMWPDPATVRLSSAPKPSPKCGSFWKESWWNRRHTETSFMSVTRHIFDKLLYSKGQMKRSLPPASDLISTIFSAAGVWWFHPGPRNGS